MGKISLKKYREQMAANMKAPLRSVEEESSSARNMEINFTGIEIAPRSKRSS